MDRSVLEKIRESLQSRRERLGNGLQQRDAEIGELDRVDLQAEVGDVAQALEQIGRNSSIQEQELREIQAIDQALARLSRQDFGFCEDCTEEIPVRRLLAVPEARLCTRCQDIRERESQRMRPTG